MVEKWSLQEKSDPRVTPSIEILSLNSSELESKDMSGRFQSTRLEIRQHWVFTALKLTSLGIPSLFTWVVNDFCAEPTETYRRTDMNFVESVFINNFACNVCNQNLAWFWPMYRQNLNYIYMYIYSKNFEISLILHKDNGTWGIVTIKKMCIFSLTFSIIVF